MRFDQENYQALVEGRKTQTARPIRQFEWYAGREGRRLLAKTLERPTVILVITQVFKNTLKQVAEEDYGLEGFNTPEEFRQCWRRIYGRFDPTEQVCVVRFTRSEHAQEKHRQRVVEDAIKDEEIAPPIVKVSHPDPHGERIGHQPMPIGEFLRCKACRGVTETRATKKGLRLLQEHVASAHPEISAAPLSAI